MSFFLLAILLTLGVNSKKTNETGLGIYDGQVTQWSEYPFMASIRMNEEDQHCCAGTIISLNPAVLLTAAHCVHPDAEVQCNKEVIIGCDHASCDSNQAVTYQVDEIVIHSDFIYNNFYSQPPQFDIAVVRLSSIIDSPNGVSNITVSSGDPCCMNLNPLTVIGYGKTRILSIPSDLRYGMEAWVRPTMCNSEADVTTNYYDWPSILCFMDYFDREVVVCGGDDGGPVVDAAAGAGQLVGIISWEWTNFMGVACDADKPQAAVNLGFLYKWIMDQLETM